MPQLQKIFANATRSGYKGYGFPSQTVSIEEKESEEFIVGCMDYMAQEARAQSRDKVQDLKKYRMLADDYDYRQNGWAMDPLALGDKKNELYGATDPIQHFPIMNQPLNTIWGERINRPYHFYCLSESPASFNEYTRQKTELLFDDVSQSIQNRALKKAISRVQSQGIKIDDQIMQQVQQEAQQMGAPAIQRYMDKDYIDTIEQSANRMMKNLWRKNNLDDEFVEGFKHGTICGKEFYSINVMNKTISIKNLNPFTVFVRKSPTCRWVSEAQHAGYRIFLTPSSVLDMYRDSLTVDDINAIEKKIYPNTRSQGVNSLTGIKSINYDTSVFADNYGTTFRELNNDLIEQMVTEHMITGTTSFRASSTGLIEVIQAYWKSYRKAGILHYYVEGDKEMKMWVDENYKEDKNAGEWIKWYYLNQVYQGTRIDDDIYVNVEPYPHQIFDAEDPDFSPLPIEGCYYNDFNGKTISLTDLMLPWQEMYDIVAYELKKDLKKAMGKVMFMSIDHIPNIPGFDMNKWMYWCKEFGIAWVGEGKKRTQFSHFSAQDMSFAEQLTSKMRMLDDIKRNCDSFAGFSPPRMADMSQVDTAKQSMQSQQNSVNQTEYYFWKHSQTIQKVLTNALNIGKKLVKEGTSYLRNLYDDMEIRYLEADGSKISNANLNLFVVHGSQAITRTEQVRQMAVAAAAKTGDSMDMSDLILATTENEIKQIGREIRRRRAQQEQQQQQFEAEQNDKLLADKKEERAWDKEKHYSKLESEERQEYIRSFINQDDNLKDADGNKVPDILEGQKVIEEQANNLREHQRELREQDINKDLKDKELQLKNKELRIKEDKNQVDRENQKNDLAIARQNAKGRSKTTKK